MRMPEVPHNTFPKSARLSGKLAFARVYEKGSRERRGPLMAVSLPNDLGHARLGLSVSRAVGTAPRRNRIKRLIRESFRLMRHNFPNGYDIIIVVRPHEPAMLEDYQRMMNHFLGRMHSTWTKTR